ncbi:MAG: alpha/beta hydrolase [Planctomycetaceae bacterium]|nr:alpha/beta hydrolase [Planctomycetales bacterium]MCB9924295.1 alpha/beta hydrolase [Planctomycetaceae bacterium]
MNDQTPSMLDSPAISGCYLFPQPRRIRNPFVVAVDDAELACYRNIVDPAAFTVVHFHGNGEAVADYVPDFTDQLSALGLNSLFVEYREYGGSTGRARLVSMLADGERVLAAAEIAPDKAIVFGRSIGSLYAIELAYRCPNIAGLVIESGIADPAERFLAYADLQSAGLDEQEVMAEVKRHFDHKSKLSTYTHPLLILHAERDGLIDISHAERNLEWAASTQKKLIRFARGDHNSIMAWNFDEYLKALADFVRSL